MTFTMAATCKDIQTFIVRTKIFFGWNEVYNNRNFIPFYDPDGDEAAGNDKPDYGTVNQTYIIDGSGREIKTISPYGC